MPTPIDANPNDWTVTLNDDFSTHPLDDSDSQWELGWGWGLGSSSWPDKANAEEVEVENGTLHLGAVHEGGSDPQVGVLHTKGKYEYGPGSYHEARVKIPSDGRFASAFWSKTSRDPPEWPPEIDYYEFLGDRNKSNIDHTVHYVDGGGEPGGDHAIAYPDGHDTPTGQDLSDEFHTYGFEWVDGGADDGSENILRWYFDGEAVATLDASVTDSSGDDWNGADALQSCRKGAPFYTMIGCSSDASPSSGETLTSHTEVEYVRSFEYTPGEGNAGSVGEESGDGNESESESESGDSTQQTDAGGTPIPDNGRQYVWMRSGDGNEASLTFDAPAIEYDGSEPGYEVDSQPDSDGQRGEMETSKTSDLPGMVATGDGGIEAMTASSNADVFVSDGSVDPADYPTPVQPRRIEVRRADESSGGVHYIVETDGGVTVARGGDNADGSKAQGVVWGGTDRYDLSDGEVVDVSTFGGEVVVTVDESVI